MLPIRPQSLSYTRAAHCGPLPAGPPKGRRRARPRARAQPGPAPRPPPAEDRPRLPRAAEIRPRPPRARLSDSGAGGPASVAPSPGPAGSRGGGAPATGRRAARRPGPPRASPRPAPRLRRLAPGRYPKDVVDVDDETFLHCEFAASGHSGGVRGRESGSGARGAGLRARGARARLPARARLGPPATPAAPGLGGGAARDGSGRPRRRRPLHRASTGQARAQATVAPRADSVPWARETSRERPRRHPPPVRRES